MNNKHNTLWSRIWAAIRPKAWAKRTYAAGRVSRFNAGWTQYPTAAKYERRNSLSILIARSREAARNFPHIVNYVRLMCENVIGSGVQLQSRARRKNGKLNVPLNQRVEEAWWEWSHAETCTASGLLDWKGVQDLAVTQCEVDGAFLIQMVEADNAFGFALKTWDVTWLDPTFNDIPARGNRIVMSVEIDANDRPVAYWLTQPLTEGEFIQPRTRERVRIPADEMIHGIRNWDSESQVHGVPGTAAALLAAKNTYSYTESVVMASRVAANQFAVLKNTAPDGDTPAFDGREDDEGNPQHPFIDSSPLAITPMLPGWEMQQFKPEQPTQNHPAFKQTLDMEIAVALGVPYFLLMGNWEAVNFSSSRGGLGEFRERCESYQTFIATVLCRRVFHAWLRSSWLTGKLELTADEFAEVQNPMWQPRGFDYIDPTKDINADVTKLQNRLATPSEILAERGVDYTDFLERWQSDAELAAGYGIDIEEIYSEPKAAAPAPEKEPNDEEDGEKDDKPAARALTNGHARIFG